MIFFIYSAHGHVQLQKIQKRAIHNQNTSLFVESMTEKEQGEEKLYFACPLLKT